MSKAVLVIDMPESCMKCPFLLQLPQKDLGVCLATPPRNKNVAMPKGRGYWCPLQELPERNPGKPELKSDTYYQEDVYGFYRHGWNACLDVIEGGIRR